MNSRAEEKGILREKVKKKEKYKIKPMLKMICKSNSNYFSKRKQKLDSLWNKII